MARIPAENLSAELALAAEIRDAQESGSPYQSFRALSERMVQLGMRKETVSTAYDVLADQGAFGGDAYRSPVVLCPEYRPFATWVGFDTQWPPQKWVGPSQGK